MALKLIEEHRCFGGRQTVYRHRSDATGTAMEFAIFLPEQAEREACPMLTYLSGLACTWANATEKAGAQQHAAKHGLALLIPDTSPRGTDLPGEHDSYDFGSGAGFYIDAAVEPWSRHYRMETYVTEELPALIADTFPIDTTRQGVFGHSMGGHGALTLALKSPRRYRSVSAFAPIVAPSQVPWGQEAFTGYLGPDRALWLAHDACALVGASGWTDPILIDQGLADPFLDIHLKPELFEAACAATSVPLTLRRHEGYDHSYAFIATFMGDHIAHHARALIGDAHGAGVPEPPSRDRCIDYIEFTVADIGRAKAFYGAAFGWTFTDYGPTYCEFTDGHMKGGFDASAPATPGRPLVVLYGLDLAAALWSVEAAGGTVVKPVFAFPGGRRFHFTDPDGYELAVWSDS